MKNLLIDIEGVLINGRDLFEVARKYLNQREEREVREILRVEKYWKHPDFVRRLVEISSEVYSRLMKDENLKKKVLLEIKRRMKVDPDKLKKEILEYKKETGAKVYIHSDFGRSPVSRIFAELVGADGVVEKFDPEALKKGIMIDDFSKLKREEFMRRAFGKLEKKEEKRRVYSAAIRILPRPEEVKVSKNQRRLEDFKAKIKTPSIVDVVKKLRKRRRK